MSRPPDSEIRLAAEAQALIGQPFLWGETDCTLVCLRLLDAMLGTDHAEKHRGLWSDTLSARRWIEKHYSFGLGLANQGARPVPPAFAQPGDMLTAEDWNAYCVLGAKVITSAPNVGVVLLPLEAVVRSHGDALRCWRL